MRYYGREGGQCIGVCRGADNMEKCRYQARNLLFGRVPKLMVMVLGGLLLTLALGSSLMGLGGFDDHAMAINQDQAKVVDLKN